jgi:hypothetical protein
MMISVCGNPRHHEGLPLHSRRDDDHLVHGFQAVRKEYQQKATLYKDGKLSTSEWEGLNA